MTRLLPHYDRHCAVFALATFALATFALACLPAYSPTDVVEKKKDAITAPKVLAEKSVENTADGGEIQAGTVKLTIPRGALAKGQTLALKVLDKAPGTASTSAETRVVIELTPHGTMSRRRSPSIRG